MLGAFTYLSYKRGRILPGLWFVLGIFAMSWIEAPFDNAMYAQFHPDFHRLPAIGPIGMTQGQLPVIAPPGYIMYFLLPALIAVGIAKLIIKRFDTNRVNTFVPADSSLGSPGICLSKAFKRSTCISGRSPAWCRVSRSATAWACSRPTSHWQWPRSSSLPPSSLETPRQTASRS